MDKLLKCAKQLRCEPVAIDGLAFAVARPGIRPVHHSIIAALSFLVLLVAQTTLANSENKLEVELEIIAHSEYLHNSNLNRAEKNDIGVSEPEASLTVTYAPHKIFAFSVGWTLTGEAYFVDQANEEEDITKLELDKVLLSIKLGEDSGAAIHIGREKLRDRPREWLLSETLDGVRFTFDSDKFKIDTSITREKIVAIDLLRSDEEPPINNYVFFTSARPTSKIWLGGYAIYRDDRTPADSDLLFVGTRSYGDLSKDIRFWFDTGWVTGNLENQDVSGYAVDFGVTKSFDLPMRPSITIGYAWGSGDDNSDDGTDRAYRQTGLHANEGKLAGVTEIKYYGHVFEPDLSNLQILTVGLSLNWDDRRSIEIVYHNYRLNEFTEELDLGNLEGELNLRSKDLGNEIDLILAERGFAGLPWLTASFVAAYFIPGAALVEENRDPAAFFRVEFVANFGAD